MSEDKQTDKLKKKKKKEFSAKAMQQWLASMAIQGHLFILPDGNPSVLWSKKLNCLRTNFYKFSVSKIKIKI